MTAEHADNIPTYGVNELSQRLQRLVERNFQMIRVCGDIIECSFSANGHCYIRFQEDRATLEAVIWRSRMSHLTHPPKKGDTVVATGSLTTWPGASRYQLRIDNLELAGEGLLLQQIERTKKKLEAEGLFAPEKKRLLPKFIRTVGLVTSKEGSVLHDIINRVQDRFPLDIILSPATVQGENAVASVVTAMEKLQRITPIPDVIIIARGGGSLTDLLPFSQESLLRCVAACPVPTVSAIGHQTDTMLIDYAADVRAATPTAAAELVTPITKEHYVAKLSGHRHASTKMLAAVMTQNRHTLTQLWRQAQSTQQHFMRNATAHVRRPPLIRDQFALKTQRLTQINAIVHQSQMLLQQRLRQQLQYLGQSRHRFTQRAYQVLAAHHERVGDYLTLAKALSPEAVLERGYSIIRDAKTQTLVTRADRAPKHGQISIQFAQNQRLPAQILTKPAETSPKKRNASSSDSGSVPLL